MILESPDHKHIKPPYEKLAAAPHLYASNMENGALKYWTEVLLTPISLPLRS